MIKAIIFDAYGVLIGSGFSDTYAAAGGDPVRDAEFIREFEYKFGMGQISIADYENTMAGQLGITPDEFRRINTQQEHVNVALLNYILTDLKPHFKLGILSNANTGALEHRLSPQDLSLFDVVTISANEGMVKPDPRFFQVAADKLGVRFDEAVFIDDSPDYVEAAKRLGLHAICYQNLHQLKKELQPFLSV